MKIQFVWTIVYWMWKLHQMELELALGWDPIEFNYL